MDKKNSIIEQQNFLKGHTGSVIGIEILSDTKVATASVDKTIKIWDLVTK